MKSSYVLFLISLLMCSMNAALATEPASMEFLPSVAPLNPAFVNYIEKIQLENGALSQPSDGELFGYIPSPVDYSHLRPSDSQVQSLSLPSSFDLRPLGRMTPIKDQGSYGTCWAHAAMASLESCTRSKTGDIFDFSENSLINLNGFDWDGWWGANATMATAYFTRWSGPVLEASDPYPHPGESSVLPPARHVVNVKFLPSRTSATDNTAIKQAITNDGAVLASYYHDVTYTNFYKESTYSYYYPGGHSSDGQNHSIVLVGWDDNYARTNFRHTPPANGAFIVKNSWGTWWGEAGYFYISYYDIRLAYDEVVVFYDAMPTNTYRKVYQYDPLGKVSAVGYGPTSWGANIFTATSNDVIGAVGFYAEAQNTAYVAYVYKGVTAGLPRSGTLVTQVSGTSTDAGYRTVVLPTPVAVANGSLFSIVFQLTTPGYDFPLAFEFLYPGYSSAATASEGQSYMGWDGSSWIDMTTAYDNANFCAKAYVFNETPVITGASVSSVLGVPHFQIEYTGIKGITNRVQHKVALTNLTWSSVRTNVPSYTGIQTNQIPIQTNSGVYRISLP